MATEDPHGGDRSVLGRAFAVLGAFDDRHRVRTASEIARAVGLPVPTTHRLCAKLADLGALDRDESGRLSIGEAIWELGHLSPRRQGLRESARPYMEDLFVATRENVQLTTLDGAEVVYVEQISGRQAISVKSRAGGRLPAHVSSGGLVLLAHAPADTVNAVIDAGLQALTPNSITDERTLRATLHEIRRRGHAICRQMVDPHSVALAAPVHDGPSVVAALSIVVSPSTPTEPLIPALKATARGISRALAG
ncbi:IclR family transcriptional regulator [Dietzia sp. CH92]|uniref:IclR family transcriptional regulator n=1 Tax=Dietzia sp. CH92 TaxID=3051823 RepID=UPI0028D5E64B|nr:IclR family transcriptional regulator [Dietzia sp. CH92]